jgi:predicted ATP-grasp superfamily ATP-dependent carboligase
MGDMALRTSSRPRVTAHPPAIVIGIDGAIGLTVVRELGQHGVPVHGVGSDAASISAVSRYCAASSIRPSAPVAQWLPDLIERTGARAVLAVSEADLLDLAQLPPMVGKCHILVPRTEQLRRVFDKAHTLAAAQALGLRTPQTWQPQAGEDFAARIAGLRFPLVAKWSNSPEIIPILERAGIEWIKAEFVHTPEALVALLDRYHAVGRWPLIQQYCAGVGVGQMLYMEEGAARLRFQHRRLNEWPPEGGVSTLCQAEPLARHAAQMRLSEALLAALGWSGPAMVEYRHDAATGDYWLMEVNGRFWGSLALAWHCGAHFAWESYRRAVLRDTTPAPAARDDLRARYMVPETKRIARILLAPGRIGDPFFRRRPLKELARYLLAFLHPRTRYFVFTLRDPRPWARDMTQIIGKAVRREKR